MTLAPGTRLGPFEIVSSLGAGGMGEVYRARDTRLARDVALKILPSEVTMNADRVSRFQREARTLALLNNPHIATIHGIEEADGMVGLVMELVEGHDLAVHLAAGQLPVDESLRIAQQIADGLEAAHQQGIIHRDLKPANVMLRTDGTVKLLDFGLAKVLDGTDSNSGLSQAPTITSGDLTGAGTILGTVAYMSPEQARGQSVDRRTDIWAFGCVLYEMLAGRRAFPGQYESDVLAGVLKSDPDFSVLPAETPLAVRRLLRRCLQKLPSERLRDIGDARLELQERESAADDLPATGVRASPRLRRFVGLSAGLGLALFFALLAGWLWTAPFDTPLIERRVEIVTPPSPSPESIAISPDGTVLVFVVSDEGIARLWRRELRSGTTSAINGTEGGHAPFWSPDGRSLAFFADGKLRRIDIATGAVRTLANATTGTDGTWGARNTLVFASRGNPLVQVSADGGEPSVVAGAIPGSTFSPSFLPDGRHLLYYVRGSAETRGVYLGDVENAATPHRRLFDSSTGAIYSRTGHLFFGLRDTLLAQPFDLANLTLTGNPFEVSKLTANERGFNLGVAIADGVIAHRRGDIERSRQLAWFDRSGGNKVPVGAPGETFSTPSLSRDGRHVVFYRGLESNIDVWSLDVQRPTLQRLTVGPADDVAPVWAPNGTRIAFASTMSGELQIYAKSPTASAPQELLFESPGFKIPTDWSADEKHLLLTVHGARRGEDVVAVPLSGERRPISVATSAESVEQYGQFSPDGAWVAYQSDESGRPEIYLQSFPEGRHKVAVSTDGGTQVRFAGNGREIFFVARNGDLMAVPVRFSATGEPPSLAAAIKLFAPPFASQVPLGDPRYQYVVTRGGQRFLVVAVDRPPTAPVSLILNWNPPK